MALRIPRLSGAREGRAARRRRERAERRTLMLAVISTLTGGLVVAGELARVARSRRAGREQSVEAHGARLGELAEESLGTVEKTVAVALVGYRGGSPREHALLNLLLSFSTTWAIVRLSTHAIRRKGTFGPFRNLVVGRQHVHHFVPGIGLAFVAGAVAVLTGDEGLEPWLAIPFGSGVALTLDESALLLKLDDVYWSEEGIVSVQVSFATILLLSTLALVLRVLRRGEQEVLPA